jgi:hypothetical protein
MTPSRGVFFYFPPESFVGHVSNSSSEGITLMSILFPASIFHFLLDVFRGMGVSSTKFNTSLGEAFA